MKRTTQPYSILTRLILSAVWFVGCLLASETAFGQNVTGIVTYESGEVAANASVFIAGTTIVTRTDDAGAFSIPLPDFGGYEMVAVDATYALASARILPDHTGKIALTLKTREMAAPDKAPSQELLEMFMSTAFSWTKQSAQIELMNPEALTLELDGATNTMRASSLEPFRFMNKALGYEVTIYNFDLGGNQVAYGWTGYALFKALEPSRDRDTRDWEKNRKTTYEGSQRHFLKALVDQKLKKEEFAAFFVEGPGSQSDHSPIQEAGLKSVYGTPQPVLFEGKEPGSYRIDFIGWLRIQYYGNGGDSRWERYIDRFWPVSDLAEVMKESMNVSFIQLPDYQAIFDASGILWPTTMPSIQTLGYWTFFRLADTLPLDWVPEK